MGYVFSFLFLIIVLSFIWKFIDNIFEIYKDQSNYPRNVYLLEYYIADYVKEFWGRAFDFKGKTKRKEFWLTFLLAFILYFLIFSLSIGVYVFSKIYYSSDPIETVNSLSRNISYLSWFIAIVNIIPGLSIQVRRLNDIGKEPEWVLLSFVPFISFLLIFWYSKPSFKKKSTLVKEQGNISGGSTLNDLDYVEEGLLKLESMLGKGVISEEEYEELRKKTLGL